MQWEASARPLYLLHHVAVFGSAVLLSLTGSRAFQSLSQLTTGLAQVVRQVSGLLYLRDQG